MYIKYKLYRSKNNEIIRQEAIEWVLETERDLLEIDKRITDLLTQHISNLPEVEKYGTAYIGKMDLVGIEINDNDYTGEMEEEAFMNYIHDESVMPHLNVIWNKNKLEGNKITSQVQKPLKNDSRENEGDKNE